MPPTTITDLDPGALAIICRHLAAFDPVSLAALACANAALAAAVSAGADEAWRLALAVHFPAHPLPPRAKRAAVPAPEARRSPCAEQYAALATAAAAVRRRAAAVRAHRAASVVAALERAASESRAALAAVPEARAALARDRARAAAAAAAGPSSSSTLTAWMPRAVARGLEFVHVLERAPPSVEQAALECRAAELTLHAAVETRRLAAVEGRLALARADLAAATVAARTLAERRAAARAFRSERRGEEEATTASPVGAAAVDAAERRWGVGWGWPRKRRREN